MKEAVKDCWDKLFYPFGARTRFAKPQWLQPLMARQIGVESMDTHAACRTFNILAGEGRHVIAALVLEGASL